tara:strand:+ start:281 stop:493 length:213 start_codon:yes stop_codon:yes gene_type:complete
MNLIINGEAQCIEPINNNPSLSNVICTLGFNPKVVVVELNGEIVAPSNWANLVIKENDNLEIVTIVGGGS